MRHRSAYFMELLKPYQQQRIMVFFGYGSAQKERYQIEQSKIAIGSGGMTGKGFLQGTQNQLLFLPESRTDMIFAVIAEETGFCGCSLLYCCIFFFSHAFLRWLHPSNIWQFKCSPLDCSCISYFQQSSISAW